MFWLDGCLHEKPLQPFDLTDRGLTLGDGLFDTSLARNGKVFLREAHLRRFTEGAAALGIPLKVEAAAQALDALAGSIGDGALRLTLTRGGGARGLRIPDAPKPVLFGAATPGRSAFVFSTLALATTPIRRNETSPSSRIKTLSYLDAILANKEAQTRGADETLFENSAGHVACAATGNLFAVFGSRLVTPPLSDGVLAGTVRAFVLAQAKASGLQPAEESLPLTEWLKADAIFVTNSLRLLAPCSALDRKSFGSATHPAVTKLQDEIRAAVTAECGHF
ncbi:aminotransferase class IV [Methyloferula stellata]|uniref:aminotransferase class IV n=1 Tax=Methyloferula stellata TaxID=876270 RepID=UPI00036F5A79|nr:aminotransferase class IV [Methyloferula stellata]